jgi:molybdopterin-containing oxidoreductase family iron-sulfur binding subunit
LTPGEDFDVTPACVNACPAEARFFGDLHIPDSQVAQLIRDNPTIRLREELGTNPRVYYILPEGGL